MRSASAGRSAPRPEERAGQQDAAQKAAAHAGTPTVSHRDSAGRVCLAVADNGGGARYPARTAYDTQGRPLAVIDALGRRTEEYVYRDPQPGGGLPYLAGSDMAGNPLYRVNADGGARRGLLNVAGHPIRSWDARDHAFRLAYDPAQRLTHRYVSTSGAAEILIDQAVYGEGQAAANLCGRLFRHYDMAGYVRTASTTTRATCCRASGSWRRTITRPSTGRRSPISPAPRSLTPRRPPQGSSPPVTAAGTDSPAARSFDALNRPSRWSRRTARR